MKNFFFKFSDFVTESLKIVNPASLLSGKLLNSLIKNFQNWKNYFFEKFFLKIWSFYSRILIDFQILIGFIGKIREFLNKKFSKLKKLFFWKNWKKNPFIFKTKVENWLNFVLEFAQFAYIYSITIPWIIEVFKFSSKLKSCKRYIFKPLDHKNFVLKKLLN